MTNRISYELALLYAENALSRGRPGCGMGWIELAREIRLGTSKAAPLPAPTPTEKKRKAAEDAAKKEEARLDKFR